MKNIKVFTFLTLLFFLGFVAVAKAYVSSSTNYRINQDSINIGGLDTSSSTNYYIKDTIGEVGTGTSTSSNYYTKAGYRQMVDGYISISSPTSISLSPSIDTSAGGSATGSGTWTVNTDSASGYSLSIRASDDPAMQSGANSIADYTPSTAGTPDYSWGLVSATSEFGFSAYNIGGQVDKYKNNGSSCNTGSNITSQKCWYGLSTSNETLVNRSSSTVAGGDDTVVNFQAEISAGSSQAAGTYTATIEVTAVVN